MAFFLIHFSSEDHSRFTFRWGHVPEGDRVSALFCPKDDVLVVSYLVA